MQEAMNVGCGGQGRECGLMGYVGRCARAGNRLCGNAKSEN